MIPDDARTNIREFIERFLLEEKGYSREDIETGIVLNIELGESAAAPVLDIVVRLKDKRLIAVKCAPGSVVSREMETLAMARILDDYQIPFCAVTNGREGEFLDTASGRVIGTSLRDIPSKGEILGRFGTLEFKPIPPKKVEQAKKVLLAAETIKCPLSCDC